MESDSFVSMKHNVEFPSVLDQYPCSQDLVVNFEFGDYLPQEGDRIAIFKLGWCSVRDYVVFEWAPLKLTDRRSSVVFKKNVLPKSNTDMYQICYISKENELHGASSPFQVGSNLMTPMSSSVESKKSLIFTDKSKDDEISRLKEENQMLMEALGLVVRQGKHYEQDISSLKSSIDKLSEVIKSQQMEIQFIKEKITEGTEGFKKLSLEKSKLEKDLESLKFQKEEKIINDNLDFGDLKNIPPFPFP